MLMENMHNSSTIRKEWSTTIDSIIREKPIVFNRNRDNLFIGSLETIRMFLTPFKFTTKEHMENNDSITIELNEIDLVANGKTKEEAYKELCLDLLEYAETYYSEFSLWNNTLNRKHHLPYILNVLLCETIDDIMMLFKE